MWDQWREQLSWVKQTAPAPVETMFPYMLWFCPLLMSAAFFYVFKWKYLKPHRFLILFSCWTARLASNVHLYSFGEAAAAWFSFFFVSWCCLYFSLLSDTLFLFTHHIDVSIEFLDHDSCGFPGQLLLSYEEANACLIIKRHYEKCVPNGTK